MEERRVFEMITAEEVVKSDVGHVVSVSGGADSATVLAMAKNRYDREVKDGIKSHLKAFHCNYGQRTEARELKAFHDLCDFYGIVDSDRIVVDMSFLKQLGGSSLTDNSIEVDVSADSLKSKKIPKSFVPGRNIIFLSMCSSVAAINNSSDIWIGVVEEDSSGYPDCRGSFIEAMQTAINEGMPSGTDFMINSPLIYAKKNEIIKLGTELCVPYELTWSCYKSSEKACGQCDSCKLRVKSFIKNGLIDPIEYEGGWDKIVEDYKTWGID